MRSTWRGFLALGATLVVGGVLASACSSDSSGGGSSTGGKDGGTGGSTGGTGGSTGGTGGSTGGTGGSTGDGGCLPAPTDTAQCDLCQDEKHAECACDAELTGCLDDPECSALWDCVIDGEADAGVDPCPTSFDEAGAACVLQCAALHPTGKAKYLAMEKCEYCAYCGTACETATYCSALDKTTDGGTPDSGSDATSDASGDSAAD